VALRGSVFPGPSEGEHVKCQRPLGRAGVKTPNRHGIGTEFQGSVKRAAVSAAFGPD
jgi:hypothetical protein